MTAHEPSPLSLTTGVSRRGVVRTAAWSVPAVSLASAAPAFATTSGGSPTAGLHVLPVMSWTATAEEIEENPYVVLFPGDGLLLGAYLFYLPESPEAPTLIQPTVTARVPMWTGAEDLAIAGDWVGLSMAPGGSEWQRDKPGPVTTAPGPLLSADGEFVFSMPDGLPAGELTAVLAQLDVSDHLSFGSPAMASTRVTPPATSDFVSNPVLTFAEFQDASTAFMTRVAAGMEGARRMAGTTWMGFPLPTL